MQNLHVRKKTHMAHFGKNKKLTPTLLRCASIPTNSLFNFVLTSSQSTMLTYICYLTSNQSIMLTYILLINI